MLCRHDVHISISVAFFGQDLLRMPAVLARLGRSPLPVWLVVASELLARSGVLEHRHAAWSGAGPELGRLQDSVAHLEEQLAVLPVCPVVEETADHCPAEDTGRRWQYPALGAVLGNLVITCFAASWRCCARRRSRDEDDDGEREAVPEVAGPTRTRRRGGGVLR